MTHRTLAAALATLCLALSASAAHAIEIRELHENTSSGVPNKFGNRFSVTGVITMPDGVRSATNTEVAVQDSTGGIVLFQSGGAGVGFTLGDSISIEGTVTQFNGLTELTTLSNYTLHAAGQPVPEPLVLTCADVNNTLQISVPDSFPEFNESRLIRINDVQVIAGAWPTTCTGSNTVLTIQDNTATTSLFIDRDSELCGSPDPSGPFDVIGILSQFDTTAPFNGGYEIVPRFLGDILPSTPGPSFVSGPEAIDVDSTSATIVWETDTNATSGVEYGTTTAYGLSEGDSTLVTNHSVPLAGLTPGQLYHFRVWSTDGSGTRVSQDKTFITASSAPGTFNVYFNWSVDPSLAWQDTAFGGADLTAPILNRIDSAQHDISVAIYTFNLSSIADALIAAWNRGVSVRLILDAGVGQTQADRLRAEGIPVITSTFGGNHGDGGIHHNKFFLFDVRDVTSSTDDWLWTGSVNMTTTNVVDANNGLEIQDTGLCQAYLLEFDEMWGSSTDTPDAGQARLGSAKANDTPHNLTVNGIPMELYFSPSDGTEAEIVNEVNAADHTFFFAQSIFTSNPIANALEFKHDNVPGFAVRGVFDAGNAFQPGSEYPNMKPDGGSNPWSPGADVWLDTEPNDLHHKYGIVDEGFFADDPTVITGSHNWSNAANTVNDENTLIIHDANIANLFLQEFAERYHAAGGTADLQVVAVGDLRLPNGMRLSAPWPNPALRGGTIEFALPEAVAAGQPMSLRLHDLRGRLVRTLYQGEALAGPQRVAFDGRDAAGQHLPAGIYFLELSALGQRLTQKWVVLE